MSKSSSPSFLTQVLSCQNKSVFLEKPVYINLQSNHPPNIIADIPKAISKRLTNISCNKNVFDRNVDIYQTALKNSDFDRKITYNNQSEQASNVNTNVNVLFFGTTHLTL